MKNIIFILIFSLGMMTACNEKDLTEVPKDFLSPDNAFINKAGFESALANIYLGIRTKMLCNNPAAKNAGGRNAMLGCDADIMYATSNTNPTMELFFWNTLNSDDPISMEWWSYLYNFIYQANVIIDRAEGKQVKWISANEKNAIVGEAKFLRAFAYHFLANMWGGVPLTLHEITIPRFDYTKATQEEVYQQCKEDLEFAVQWMLPVDQLQGGRAPKAAAYHLLSEVLICLKDNDGAINAASKVINDPNFYLMTERFGKRKNFMFNGYDYRGEYEVWGDVYWDLFQEGNMNWKDGNHEAIWNTEFEYNTPGGDGAFAGENIGPYWWGCIDKNGVANFQKDTLSGRPNCATTMTNYFINKIWQFNGDWDRDIRNSKYNIQREYYFTNPASKYYGQVITEDKVRSGIIVWLHTSPQPKKTVSAVHYGALKTAQGQNHDNGNIYKDWYLMRLPETYLLRAEAYLDKGDKASAAADINVIRNRAHATPVTAGDVNIDLILDERVRELHVEEFRMNTLMRMGKLVEYLMKYNEIVIKFGYSLDNHLNKLPIPRSEIEANTGIVLEQNPGYK